MSPLDELIADLQSQLDATPKSYPNVYTEPTVLHVFKRSELEQLLELAKAGAAAEKENSDLRVLVQAAVDMAYFFPLEFEHHDNRKQAYENTLAKMKKALEPTGGARD